MSEEETAPYNRRRRFRNKIYQVIFVIVGLQTLYFSFRTQSTPLKEWPADLVDRSAYCKLENYSSCHGDDWFGIMKSRVGGNTGILKEICKDWADKHDASNSRLIDAADGDVLFLCKMKDPAKIDPVKVRL